MSFFDNVADKIKKKKQQVQQQVQHTTGIFARNLMQLTDGRLALRDPEPLLKAAAPVAKKAAQKAQQIVMSNPIIRGQVEAAKFGGNLAKGVLQGSARSGGSVGLEFNNRVLAPLTNNSKVHELGIDPTGSRLEQAFQRVLFGDEPVEDLTTRINRAPGRADDFAKSLGLNNQKVVNSTTAPLFILGLTAMDFTTGGEKRIATQLAKMDKAGDVANFIRKNISGMPDGAIDDIAEKIAKTTDEKAIGTMLNQAIDGTGKMVANARRVGNEVISTTRERGFITTVKNSDKISPEVKAAVDAIKDANYSPLKNTEAFQEAKRMLTFEPSLANKLAFQTKGLKVEDLRLANAVSFVKIAEAEAADNIDEARRLIEAIAERSTPAGQGIQMLSALNRLSPAGIIKYAQSVFDDASEGFKLQNGLKVTDDMAKKLFDMAKKIQKMPDGEDKLVETALMLKEIQDQLPVSAGKQISTIQTMAQLLNPKTFIRNLGGNVGFMGLENISDIPAAMLDSPLSLLTGKRTKLLTSIPMAGVKQGRGFKEGLRQGFRDALLGIDTYGVPTQFDLPTTPVFKGQVGKAAEKLLNLELKAFDRAFYKAAYDGSLYQQMTAANATEVTNEMMEVAHHDALYRTFQDDSVLAQSFVKLKSALNGGKDFGLGDLLLKYPKTPANLLSRGLAYSPAGFARTVYHAARPLMGKAIGRNMPFDQKAFVESFGRAITGTGALFGTGALLHRVGIITGERDSHKDVANLKDASGLGQYRINVSALKRFALSGFDTESAKREEGDLLVSYDWFQPAAIALSIGANIDEGASRETFATTIMSSLESGIDTLAEQPLVQGVANLFKFGSVGEALKETLLKAPSTFVPTLMNQFRQLADNQRRMTYHPEDVQYAWNMVKNRVPGMSDSLPSQVDVLGRNQEMYQNGSNNFMNVFFNPAFATRFKQEPEVQLALGLYENTGDTGQVPNVISRTQKINGESVELSPTQVESLQRFVGTEARAALKSFAEDPAFAELPDSEKVNYIENVLRDITVAGKIIVLGDRPEKLSGRVEAILSLYSANEF